MQERPQESTGPGVQATALGLTGVLLLDLYLEYGGEIGGSRVNVPLHLGETPTHSTEKQSEQPKAAQRL